MKKYVFVWGTISQKSQPKVPKMFYILEVLTVYLTPTLVSLFFPEELMVEGEVAFVVPNAGIAKINRTQSSSQTVVMTLKWGWGGFHRLSNSVYLILHLIKN